MQLQPLRPYKEGFIALFQIILCNKIVVRKSHNCIAKLQSNNLNPKLHKTNTYKHGWVGTQEFAVVWQKAIKVLVCCSYQYDTILERTKAALSRFMAYAVVAKQHIRYVRVYRRLNHVLLPASEVLRITPHPPSIPFIFHSFSLETQKLELYFRQRRFRPKLLPFRSSLQFQVWHYKQTTIFFLDN